MANTYSQIYIQIVFAVEGRQNLISQQHREELHKYITGIVQNRSQKMLSIFCMPDHTHILIGLTPPMAISDLVRDKKQAHRSLSMIIVGCRADSIGKKDSEHFHIPEARSIP
jgi:REP element-mobilizing transposase RayT